MNKIESYDKALLDMSVLTSEKDILSVVDRVDQITTKIVILIQVKLFLNQHLCLKVGDTKMWIVLVFLVEV